MNKLKTAILAVILTLSVPVFGTEQVKVTENVKFEKDNFFAITSAFDQGLLDNFTEKVLSYNEKKLYVYFDSPGGSVIALSRMVRIMKNHSNKIKFVCIANFAASAAFMLFEHCNQRLLVSDGILMSHNWSGGFEDEYPRMLSLMNAIQSLVGVMEEVVIGKMSVDTEEYMSLINRNLWMPLRLAEKYGAIDGTANVTCSKTLIKQRLKTSFQVRNFFGGNGEVQIVYKSGCPLIQKTYSRPKQNGYDEFVENSQTLFNLSQQTYKSTDANWIYKGNKRK